MKMSSFNLQVFGLGGDKNVKNCITKLFRQLGLKKTTVLYILTESLNPL